MNRNETATAGGLVPYRSQECSSDALAALKQAAHIRVLKPDECIAVSVFGPAAGAGTGTVLTLRAKKPDVDAFAKGDLDLAAFRRRTSLGAYVGPGHDITSLNSWMQGARSSGRNMAPASSSGSRPGR